MENKLSSYYSLFFILCFTFILSSGCEKKVEYDVSISELNKIYNLNVKDDILLNSKVDLYVDYSTCVREAVNNSAFFETIRPRITGLNPTLFAIRGPDIDSISSEMDIINRELNGIGEIPFANIKGSVERIVSRNNQAILITDCEYWTQLEGERTDLPYMKESFIKWIERGNELYIFTETYSERFRGRTSEKMRFYLLFTSDGIENNIYNVIKKSDGFKDLNISRFKITNSDFQIVRTNEIIDNNLQFSVDTTSQFDFIEIENQWEDIFKLVLSESDESGSPTLSGIPLIINLNLKSRDLENYKIENVDIIATNITDQYLDSLHSPKVSENIPNVFKLGKDRFKEKNELEVFISEDLINYLKVDTVNLIRIDFILKNVINKPINRSDFVWNSISNSTKQNVSVYESINQTIDNPLSFPAKTSSGIIHTIFLKTPAYK